MPKKTVTLNRAADDALHVLASQIRVARHQKGWTAADLGARIGVSARTVVAIESGGPGVSIGSVFNAATVTGVKLFGAEGLELTRLRRRGEELVALIPHRTFRPKEVDDPGDFDF